MPIYERCGKEFDPFEAEIKFQSAHEDDAGASLSIFDEILCEDCAEDAYDEIPIIPL